jgi:hypothetical protein
MSYDQLNKLMRDLTRNREIVRRCKAEPAALLKDYALTEVECEAVATWHLRRLYDLGANPLLLLASSMAMGKNLRDYAAALRRK